MDLRDTFQAEWRRALWTAFLGLTAVTAHATTCVMVPWSGSDGTFNVVSESGYSTVCQATGSSGSYSGFQYYQRPSGVNFTAGNPLYVEVDYLDQSGSGNIGIQYDSTSNAFQACNFGLNNSVLNTGAFKTAVYRLDSASFSLSENGGNDMRLTGGGNLQLNIIQVRVSDSPTTLYLQDTAFLGPYSGPSYVGGTPVDATTIVGKTVAGYQGWYGAPGDEDNIGWSHWLNGSQLQIDFWPDMTEYTTGERFNFPPYTNSGGSTAQLFSSDEARTSLRHFQWMEAWGIDGVAVQRFVGSVPSEPLDRVLTNVRLAANETGRTYFVEYDMSGMAEANLVSAITNDWNYLNNTLNITGDSRYLRQGGLPVIGIFGFFTDRFSTGTANAILDIFKTGSAHPAFVLGSGAWWWNEGTDATWTPAWKSVVYRMGAWQPWNVGNAGGSPSYAGTGYWTDNNTTLAANNVMFQPMLYAGCSSVNRDGSTPGSGVARLSGAVYWNQFSVAKSLNAKTAFIAMFDEFSEGTQIAKATGSPPTNAPNTQVYDGMPSDCYLCFTAQGSRWLKGLAPLAGGSYSAGTVPGCAALTQPSIPDPISPLSGATVTTSSTTFTWSAALALAGGGSLTGYVLNVDGTTYSLGNVLTDTLALANGSHWWRVQAVNSLGNASGYSVAQTFTVSGTGTATRTPSRTATFTPSPSPTPTPTPLVQNTWRVNSGGPAYTDTLGHVWSADQNYSGGTVNATTNTIAGTTDPALYQDERWGVYNYTFNVPAGNYQVTLKFAELYWNAVASRVFNVSINGATVLTNLDIFAEVGQNHADDKVFDNIAPSGGQIVITLGPASHDNPTIDAIQIIPEPSTPTPTSTFTRTASPTASASPSGTRTSSSTPTVTATPSPTATRTATPSPTASPSSTLVPTKTPSPSSTNSPLPTGTPSWTASPAATKTNTPLNTATPSWTVSPAATKTNTPLNTATPSWTVSPAATKTNTLTNTPRASATASWTASPLASATPSWTASPLLTKTNTPLNTATPSWTLTDTAPPTTTGTLTATALPTAAATSTGTAPPTAAVTPLATASPSPWPSASRTPLFSPTATPQATWSKTLNSQVLDAEPVPNPQPGPVLGFDIKLSADCGSLSGAIYTPAMILVAKQTFSGQFKGGWNKLSWSLPKLPNGLYYAVFNTAFGQRARITRLYILN